LRKYSSAGTSKAKQNRNIIENARREEPGAELGQREVRIVLDLHNCTAVPSNIALGNTDSTEDDKKISKRTLNATPILNK
jgi:hypothetical protein